jgi:NAD(P)H-nitrite reductase large subunit
VRLSEILVSGEEPGALALRPEEWYEDHRVETLLGDVGGARELSTLLRSGDPVPEALLGPPGAAAAEGEVDPDALVCSCNAVSRAEIEGAIRSGAALSTGDVGRVTRAGTGCGSCVPEIEALLRAQDSSVRNTGEARAKRTPARIGA